MDIYYQTFPNKNLHINFYLTERDERDQFKPNQEHIATNTLSNLVTQVPLIHLQGYISL